MNRIVTPMHFAGFDTLLTRYNLSNSFPTLVHRIRYGFPLGNFMPLLRTYVFRNHVFNPSDVDRPSQYLAEEVAVGRMSGPFTEGELRWYFGNQHFQTAPLGVVPKASEPGCFRIIRDASYKGDAPRSVNDQIDPDEQATRWGKALDMAEIVSGTSPAFAVARTPRDRAVELSATRSPSPSVRPPLRARGRRVVP